MLSTSKLAYMFFAEGASKYFLKITLNFCFSWLPVYTDEDQQMVVMPIGFLLINRDDAVHGEELRKMVFHAFILFTYIFFDLP